MHACANSLLDWNEVAAVFPNGWIIFKGGQAVDVGEAETKAIIAESKKELAEKSEK
jgi:hypothetical protein